MTSINLPSSFLFYQNPVDIYQTQNGSTQVNGRPTEINSCRGCNKNLASDDPASQYQRQKIIQNTVRVQSSLYTMNLAGLSGYQSPLNVSQIVEQAGSTYIIPPRVYWNQMSDRAKPANQVAKVASGSTYHSSSTRHSITRNRPGAMSPGGIGVDIKHNSYDRYLNKLKGKAPLRRGVIPITYGDHTNFNRAFPVYGGKNIKTNIINGCDCPDIADMNIDADKRIYGSISSATQDKILSVKYTYNIGDIVWAKKDVNNSTLYRAEILDIVDGIYTVLFTDDDIVRNVYIDELLIYFDCNCNKKLSLQEELLSFNQNQKIIASGLILDSNIYCNLLNLIIAD
jgi:hypothetical protein